MAQLEGRVSVFDRIYRDNLWRGAESRSGPGSGFAATTNIASALVTLVAELAVTSVLDVGCGDGLWMPDLPGYVGIDVSEEALRLARRNHPDRQYEPWSEPGRFDLVIVRDAIQHLPLAEGVALLEAVSLSGSAWLLASTYHGGDNIDITSGDSYSPDLEVAPFSLGQPERVIFDGYTYHDASAVRDPRKHLGLWPLST